MILPREGEEDVGSCFETASYSTFLRRPSSFYTAAESSATYGSFVMRQQHPPPQTIYGSAYSSYQPCSFAWTISDNGDRDISPILEESLSEGFSEGRKENHSYVNGDFQRRVLEEEERIRREVFTLILYSTSRFV